MTVRSETTKKIDSIIARMSIPRPLKEWWRRKGERKVEREGGRCKGRARGRRGRGKRGKKETTDRIWESRSSRPPPDARLNR